jgi:phospholipase A-2-activating protein
LKQANPDAVFTKIQSLNSEMADTNKLSDEEIAALASAVAFLKAPSSGASLNSNAGLTAVIKMASQWPTDKRFPALDLIRLFSLYAPVELASSVPQRDVVGFLMEFGGLKPDSTSSETNAMLAYRGLANLFQQEVGRALIWERRNTVADVMQVDVSGKFKGKNARLAQSTLAVK